MSKEQLPLKYHFTIEARDKDNNIKATNSVYNTVMNVGKIAVGKMFSGEGGPVASFVYIALGSNNAAVVATQTTLSGEIADAGCDRSIDTTPTTSGTGSVAVINKTFSVTNTVTVKEAGLFNGAVATGSMFARTTFSDVNVVSGDTIACSWNVSIS